MYDRSAAWVRLQAASYLRSQTNITIQQTGLLSILRTIPFQGKTYPNVQDMEFLNKNPLMTVASCNN